MAPPQVTQIGDFPWYFLDLKPGEKAVRREILDGYGFIAQYSVSLPLVAYLVLSFFGAVIRRFAKKRDSQGSYEQIPLDSDDIKPRVVSSTSFVTRVWRALCWWITDEIYIGRTSYGTKDQWIIGILWTVWLCALSTMGTGDDYYHLSKRFGLVAMSQLPAHYAMANKVLNPFAYAFGTSYEVMNRYHRVYGRVIYFLLLCHFALYITAFVVQGTFFSRLFEPIVAVGIVGSIIMHAVIFTSFKAVRDRTYRLFFVIHVLAGFAIPVLIFFHATAARLYLIEALTLFIIDLLCRKLTTTIASANVELISDSNLLKVTLEVTPSKASEFNQQPGSHLLSRDSIGRTTWKLWCSHSIHP